MIENATQFIELRTSDDPSLYHRASHDTADRAVWLEIVEKYPEMRFWVAQNKTIPIELLEILANDEDPNVRHMVAMKRKLPHSLFELLAKDSSETVRLAIAKNPKTPEDILDFLANDAWHIIQDVVKRKRG